MAATPYFAMYPTDFLADIGHLGNTELGIYWRLLLVYYRDGRPLPFDPDRLRRLAMTFNPEECRALEAVMSEFFVLSKEPDGRRVWRHRRADIEVARAEKYLNAKRGGAEKARAIKAEKKVLELISEQTSTLMSGQIPGGEPEPEPEVNTEPTVLVDEAAASTPYRCPPSPNEEVVSLYHEALPSLPSVVVLNDSRKRAIGARWREVCASDRLDKQAGLEWFAWFFGHVSKSDFLMGRSGKRTWSATFDWLMTPTKFARVVEGAYHGSR